MMHRSPLAAALTLAALLCARPAVAHLPVAATAPAFTAQAAQGGAISTFDLREALGSVLEDRKASLRASGIELLIELPKMLPLVLGDIKRTHQALSAALDCAVSISSPGDYIELRVSIHNEFVELNLQNSGIRDRAIQATHRLKLTLAEVNIRSQHGKYECVEYPFEVFIALPLQEGLP